METATKNVKELTQAGGSASDTSTVKAEVNKVAQTPPQRVRTQKLRFTGVCYCCGRTGHKKERCRHREAVCHKCHLKGHLQKMCRNHNPKHKKVHKVEEKAHESTDEEDYELWAIKSSKKSKSYSTKLEVDGKSLQMEIDTGASLTLVSEQTFRSLWPNSTLNGSRITLSSYGGESIPVLGTVDVHVGYGDQEAVLPLLVVKGKGPRQKLAREDQIELVQDLLGTQCLP